MNNTYKKLRPLLAFMCAAGWSLAYPLIKLGYVQFGIVSDDLGSKILFAGIRFFSAGILVLLIFALRKRKMIKEEAKGNMAGAIVLLLLLMLFNITLHYLFSYIGLAYIPSSRGTIIDSMGSFILIAMSCIIFSDDHMKLSKFIGCCLGIAGILIINIRPGEGMFGDFSFMGDGMILLNTTCGAIGAVVTRFVSKKFDMMFATGFSMLAGGGVLCLVSRCIGQKAQLEITAYGLFILFCLIMISALCFAVYNQLIADFPISSIAIFNAFIPVLGVIFAALILGEPLTFKYIAAGLIVAAGVAVCNH